MNVVSRIVGRVLYGSGVPDPSYDTMMDAAVAARLSYFSDNPPTALLMNSDTWTCGADLSGLNVDRLKTSGFGAFCMAICMCVVVFAVSVLLTPIDHFPFVIPAPVAAFLHK